jgi:hypothetical protein
MLYVSLRKELPRRIRPVTPKKKFAMPRIVTISLINPPLCYRQSPDMKAKVVKLFC